MVWCIHAIGSHDAWMQPWQSTHLYCIQAWWRPYRVNTLPKVRHGKLMQHWWVTRQSCIGAPWQQISAFSDKRSLHSRVQLIHSRTCTEWHRPAPYPITAACSNRITHQGRSATCRLQFYWSLMKSGSIRWLLMITPPPLGGKEVPQM